MWLAVAPAQPAPVMCSGTDRKGRDCPFRGEGIEIPSWGRGLCSCRLMRSGRRGDYRQGARTVKLCLVLLGV